MKIIISLLLAAFLAFGFAGCISNIPTEADAYNLYVSANEKLAEAESFSSDLNLQLTIGTDAIEEAQIINMRCSTSTVRHSETDIDMEMSIQVENRRFRHTENRRMYFTDGWVYTDWLGVRTKQQIETEPSQGPLVIVNNVLFAKADVMNIAVEKVMGGNQITFTLNETGSSKILDALGSNFIDKSEPENRDINWVVLIDGDGKLKRVTAEFIIDGAPIGDPLGVETNEASAKMVMEITQIGGVSVELPDDLDNYRADGRPPILFLMV